MAAILDFLTKLYEGITGRNSTDIQTTCESNIDHQLFHLWLLLPSSILIFVMGLTLQRKTLFKDILNGRPGAIFPMDILGRSNRFSYVAAWGVVGFLVSDGILGGQRAVQLGGKKSYATVGSTLLSMLVYGVDYFPLFASLAIDSLFGYVVGTAYAWMLFVIDVYQEQECDLVFQDRLVSVLRDLPLLLCLGYLSVSLPVRVVRTYRIKGFSLMGNEVTSVLRKPQKVYKTPEAKHVRKLLAPPPVPPPEADGIKEKILATVKKVVAYVLYKPEKGFRYSARVLSVMFLGVLVLYKTSIEILVAVVKVCRLLYDHYQLVPINPGKENPTNSTGLADDIIITGIDIFRGTIVSAVVGAFVLGLVQILYMLSSYRINLQHLYKGDTSHIPHRDSGWKASLLVGTMKYAGFQVGYIAWGFMVHTALFFIVALLLVVMILLLENGINQWLIDFIETFWPIIFVSLIVNYGQLLLAKVAFLQGSGDTLDIDNRRALFILTFFLFFYNIFIGLFSCLFRIIKSIVIGAIFLPRLDHSALPRRFQMMDPGFSAYVGFIHVEAVHSNPVLLTFIRLLMCRQQKDKEIDINQEYETCASSEAGKIIGHETEVDEEKEVAIIAKKVSKANIRWHLAYTLFCNPQLRAQRKSYLNGVKEMQLRLAKKYNLSRQDACVLLDNMTTMNVDVEQIDLAMDAAKEEGLLPSSNRPLEVLRAVRKITQVLEAMRKKNVSLGVIENQAPDENVESIEIQGDSARGPSRLWSRIKIGKSQNDDSVI